MLLLYQAGQHYRQEQGRLDAAHREPADEACLPRLHPLQGRQDR